MLSASDPSLWEKHDDNFKRLLSDEIDLLFKEPQRITKAFVDDVETLPQQEYELLDLLASKVVESQPTPTEDALGFTRVIDLMADLKKPLITHNGIMDLMFLYDKFYRTLPETQGEFKSAINALFPHIYDTKHMINAR